MNMLVSGIFEKDGKKVAYVSFEEDDKYAEIMIPEVGLVKNDGFNEEEENMLIEYVKENLEMLKRNAAEVNPIRSIMNENKKD